MAIRGFSIARFTGVLLSCISALHAAPLLFTNSGAGAVGIVAGANVTGLRAVSSNLTASGAADMLIGFVNTSVDFRELGPAVDTGVVDFSNSSLPKLQDCDGHGGGGPTACYEDAQSSLSLTTILGGTASDPADVAAADAEMSAVSSAWAAVSGTKISLAAGGTIKATSGALQTVKVSPQGGSSFNETGYVFTITDNGVNPSQNITIEGDGSRLVILNYTSSRAFNLSKDITLAGGITPDQVLINITDGSTTDLSHIFKASGSATIDADLIVTSGTVDMKLATLNGRLYLDGNGRSIFSDFTLNTPADAPADEEAGPAAPEPAAMILLGGGLVALGYIGKRYRARRTPKTEE